MSPEAQWLIEGLGSSEGLASGQGWLVLTLSCAHPVQGAVYSVGDRGRGESGGEKVS